MTTAPALASRHGDHKIQSISRSFSIPPFPNSPKSLDTPLTLTTKENTYVHSPQRPLLRRLLPRRRTKRLHRTRRRTPQPLAPADVLEEALVNEIHHATWRLRRCARVEAELSPLFAGDDIIRDPMEAIGEPAEKVQFAIDRARTQAHRILHRCTAELRKLQAERAPQSPQPEDSAQLEMTKRTQSDSQKRTHFQPVTARNAECPCGSGQKYKRCCGRDAPPLLLVA